VPEAGASRFAEDFHLIHRALTRAMGVAAKRARDFGQKGFPDEPTRRGFLDYVRCLVTATCAHHDAEDDVGFPAFGERLPAVPFSELEAQHEVLLPVLEETNTAVDAGTRGKAADLWLPDLEDALRRLSYIWAEHIALEEKHLTPEAIRSAFSSGEQEELGRRMAEHGRRRAEPAPLVLPFLLYNLEAADRPRFAAALPPEVAHLIPTEWKDTWAPMKPFLLP
jgi:Hemerythrin HHE cation binding domain